MNDHDGTKQRAEVKDFLEDEGKFVVEYANGGAELMNFTRLINILNSKIRMDTRCGILTILLATGSFYIMIVNSRCYGTLEKIHGIICIP